MSRRLEREKKTVAAMVRIYCKAHHGTRRGLCERCRALVAYAEERLDRCRFGEEKPVCSKCTVHCYKTSMREDIRAAMRFAGPKMITRHPILAIGHGVNSRRERGLSRENERKLSK